MTKTFLDSGVLLTAWKGKEEDARAALSIMEDTEREFYTAQMVKLELLPKPSFYKQKLEVEFYNTHFSSTRHEEPWTRKLTAEAFQLAIRHGLAAADALNAAAALRMKVEEFVTTEMPGKALFRVPDLKVVSLHAARRT
jgi:predicted nucleic acid-binding protein